MRKHSDTEVSRIPKLHSDLGMLSLYADNELRIQLFSSLACLTHKNTLVDAELNMLTTVPSCNHHILHVEFAEGLRVGIVMAGV